MADEVKGALSEPSAPLKCRTVSVPTAGKILGVGRNSAYEAAQTGEIPTIQIGRLKRVPVPWLEKKLGCQLDLDGAT